MPDKDQFNFTVLSATLPFRVMVPEPLLTVVLSVAEVQQLLAER